MNQREKIKSILNLKGDGSHGTWIGDPVPETLDIYTKELDVEGLEGIQSYFDDDCRLLDVRSCFNDPDRNGIFDFGGGKENSMYSFQLESIETVAQVEALNFPDIKHFDFTGAFNKIDTWRDKAVFTGLWSPFFHDVSDLIGMEEYFVKMYTDPEFAQALTNRVVDFYAEANNLFFTQLGDRADTFFFGNDFGTQIGLLISVDCFKKFMLPGIKRLIGTAKKHNKKVIVHSCGAIREIIPLLIDAGIDGLHPLQAKAAGMDAGSLFKEYGKDIAFMGGVDTQDLLVNATPPQVYDEVMRLREILGNNFIVSPSHEGVLPNIPLDNIKAMYRAVRG